MFPRDFLVAPDIPSRHLSRRTSPYTAARFETNLSNGSVIAHGDTCGLTLGDHLLEFRGSGV